MDMVTTMHMRRDARSDRLKSHGFEHVYSNIRNARDIRTVLGSGDLDSRQCGTDDATRARKSNIFYLFYE